MTENELRQAVKTLADEWAEEGRGLIDHCSTGRDVHEGLQLVSCADALRTALAATEEPA